MRFDPTTSLLAGMDPTTLQSALTSAQVALIALKQGQRTVKVAITGGGQHREVEFEKGNEGSLVDLIRQLQAQLGVIPEPRRRARIIYN